MNVILTQRELRIDRLMETRMEPPPPPPTQDKVVPDRRYYQAIRDFIAHATIRSVLSVLAWHLIRRPLLWLLDHIYWLFSTVCSRRIGPEELAIRWRVCSECSQQKQVGEYHYCSACGGCPRWVFARHEYALQKRGYNCSLGLHPGSVAIWGRDESERR